MQLFQLDGTSGQYTYMHAYIQSTDIHYIHTYIHIADTCSEPYTFLPKMRIKVDMFGTEHSSGTDPDPQRGQGPVPQIQAGESERDSSTPMTSLQPPPTHKPSHFCERIERADFDLWKLGSRN
jgi:hypothetical protein